MPRGNGELSKVHYKGEEEDFIVFVESPDDLKKWKTDRTIPLTEVVGNFKVYVTSKQGAQGKMDGASNSTLENEFGTKNEDEIIIKILEQGELQTTDKHGRGGDRNVTQGPRIAH